MPTNELQAIYEWEVELAISGAISLQRNNISFNVEKGEVNPFTTTITLSKSKNGVKCVLIARAYNQDNANDVAVYFVGQALDVLSLQLDIPLHLNFFRPEFREISNHVKRIINQEEWYEAFQLGRNYSLNRRYFSRALSWYRKGLISDDPIDRVVALWSALESIGSNYYRVNERTNAGIINRVCDCFDQLWGSTENWQIIPNQSHFINEFHEYRNGLSHGYMRADIDTIRDLARNLQTYQSLVYRFLCDWEISGRNLEQDNNHSTY